MYYMFAGDFTNIKELIDGADVANIANIANATLNQQQIYKNIYNEAYDRSKEDLKVYVNSTFKVLYLRENILIDKINT